VAIVGHIPADELVKLLTATEAANGFVNRYIVCLARRSKLLRSCQDSAPLSERHEAGLTLDDAALRRWWDLYATLSEPEDGLAGTICARAEAHVVRLSML
jgi:hypothetical protein